MKILELCDFYSNYGSNFIPSLEYLEKELANRGHEVFFIFSKRNLSKEFYDWEKPFSLRHHTTLFDFSNHKIINEITDFIKKNDIKIVHAHFIASFYLSEIKRRCPKSVLFFEHIHSAPYRNKKTLRARIKRLRNVFLLNHKITKICVSEAIVPMTKFIYPFAKVISCPNAIDFKRLIKKENNYIESFRILMFGYNYFVKGVDIALKAFIELLKKKNGFLDIVMSDHFFKNKKTILEDFGKIPDNVRLLPPSNNVADLYSKYSVFLNASRSEGGSYAIVEAYYSGLQCVLSDTPANVEANLPGALYFENGSSESLLLALEKAFVQRNTYKNEVVVIEEHFSLNSWCFRLLSIFGLE